MVPVKSYASFLVILIDIQFLINNSYLISTLPIKLTIFSWFVSSFILLVYIRFYVLFRDHWKGRTPVVSTVWN
jgi:hypothetical protein